MTTISINERTKAGKSFLEFAKNILFVKINEDTTINKPVAKVKLSKQQEIMKLSKEVNKNMSEKLMKQYNVHYDSNY
jgi:hypothetical protein